MTSSPIPTWLTVRYGRSHRVVPRVRVAAEHRPGYDLEQHDTAEVPAAPLQQPDPVASGLADLVPAGAVEGPAGEGPAGEGPAGEGPPFGLPVLAELPELAAVLDALVSADERLLDAVLTLSRLVGSGEVERTTGVGVEQWLGIVARQTRMDRRLLLRLCRLLDRFPTLKAAVAARQVSFAQLRGLGLALRQAPTSIDGELDAFLARLLPEVAGAAPDVVVDQVARAIDELAPEVLDAAERGLDRHLYLQPNLDRTGGRFSGETDAIGLALLDEATAPTRAQLDHPGGQGGARHDNLLGRLAHACDPDHPSVDAAGLDAARGDADATADLPPDATDADLPWPPPTCAATRTRRPATDAVRARSRSTLDVVLPPVKLLARVELDRLLDGDRMPAELVTRLVGGRLRLASDAARRLLDARGVELRTIVVDHGTVVGVGRHTRVPPGWLHDAAQAVHDTCTAPWCDRPARSCELDHAIPWHPHRPDDPAGRTDIDELGPLCGGTNRDKEAAGWHVTQTADGRRTWTHPRTGLTITAPASRSRPSRRPGDPPAPTHPTAATGTPDRPAAPTRRPPHHPTENAGQARSTRRSSRSSDGHPHPHPNLPLSTLTCPSNRRLLGAAAPRTAAPPQPAIAPRPPPRRDHPRPQAGSAAPPCDDAVRSTRSALNGRVSAAGRRRGAASRPVDRDGWRTRPTTATTDGHRRAATRSAPRPRRPAAGRGVRDGRRSARSLVGGCRCRRDAVP
jgi:hypothetical protein